VEKPQHATLKQDSVWINKFTILRLAQPESKGLIEVVGWESVVVNHQVGLDRVAFQSGPRTKKGDSGAGDILRL
jgi:hypothetical protein